MDLALDGLVLVTAWLHTIASPYTKVEESFNLHAIHDVLMYGVGVKDLDKVRHDQASLPACTDHFASTTTSYSLVLCPGRSLGASFWRGLPHQPCTSPRSWAFWTTSSTFRSLVSLDMCSLPFDS